MHGDDSARAAGRPQTIDKVKLFQGNTDAVSASAIIMFAFTCQVNVPSLYYELRDR